MRLVRHTNGQFVTFLSHSLIGRGGEAQVCSIQEDSSLSAKIFFKPTQEKARKLEVMLANPPEDPLRSLGHTLIA